jgi:hypothetical protein
MDIMLSTKLTLLAFLIGFVSSVAGGLFAQGVAATMLESAPSITQLSSIPAPILGFATVLLALPLLAYLLRRFIGRIDTA